MNMTPLVVAGTAVVLLAYLDYTDFYDEFTPKEIPTITSGQDFSGKMIIENKLIRGESIDAIYDDSFVGDARWNDDGTQLYVTDNELGLINEFGCTTEYEIKTCQLNKIIWTQKVEVDYP